MSKFRVNRVESKLQTLLESESDPKYNETSQFGDLRLTEAVRFLSENVSPVEGYEVGNYVDPPSGEKMPTIIVCASEEKIFSLFLDLLEPLGEMVTAVIECSAREYRGESTAHLAEDLDEAVLRSHLWDYEELLLADGFLSLAVLNPNLPREVQLDDHKLIIIYSQDLAPFREILGRHGILEYTDLFTIIEVQHVHFTTEEYAEQTTHLIDALGAEPEPAARELLDEGESEDDPDEGWRLN